MEWINIKTQKPENNQNILVIAKEGHYFPEVHGLKDIRCQNMYVGYFFDDHEYFKNLNPKLEFCVDCGCSGREFDRAELEVLFWRPLPEFPDELD